MKKILHLIFVCTLIALPLFAGLFPMPLGYTGGTTATTTTTIPFQMYTNGMIFEYSLESNSVTYPQMQSGIYTNSRNYGPVGVTTIQENVNLRPAVEKFGDVWCVKYDGIDDGIPVPWGNGYKMKQNETTFAFWFASVGLNALDDFWLGASSGSQGRMLVSGYINRQRVFYNGSALDNVNARVRTNWTFYAAQWVGTDPSTVMLYSNMTMIVSNDWSPYIDDTCGADVGIGFNTVGAGYTASGYMSYPRAWTSRVPVVDLGALMTNDITTKGFDFVQ